MTSKLNKLKKTNKLPFTGPAPAGWGKIFTDYIAECNNINGKWSRFCIKPYGNFTIEPSATVLHYGQSIEGLKAYRDQEMRIWLFRPLDYLIRLNESAARLLMRVWTDN